MPFDGRRISCRLKDGLKQNDRNVVNSMAGHDSEHRTTVNDYKIMESATAQIKSQEAA